jgi:hypothetical protein
MTTTAVVLFLYPSQAAFAKAGTSAKTKLAKPKRLAEQQVNRKLPMLRTVTGDASRHVQTCCRAQLAPNRRKTDDEGQKEANRRTVTDRANITI